MRTDEDRAREVIEKLEVDRDRLDWLEASISRLEDVRWRCNNEGATVREAVDWFRSDAATCRPVRPPV